MLKKGNKADFVSQPRQFDKREIPCLEVGKPYTEAVWIEARSWDEAVKKAQAGKGRKFTKEEAKQWE